MLSKAEAEEKAQTKTAIKKADVKKEENTELQDILKSSRDVLDDLKDVERNLYDLKIKV